ncbi:MAG: VOC family protein, partial [Nitrospinaceae bacterium]|nr:VOC family protein [Nitrospinaceae bacterium]NIR55765.1 VOC family protein [Nitrospinaceae bacterium]NIS86213.1 VOC family protein [Nitrospinaceae bacterium]NIT83048.1 VOC family protein [Nitrospinaceae bacterium]NIU45258.1 VOC family protein [Nitrospinaceae bacterium]
VLGLPTEREQDFRDGKVSFPSVRINAETLIDLFPQDTPGAPPGPSPLHHLCLALEKADWDALRQRLERHGVSIQEGPVSRWGARGQATSIYFQDPEGNPVEARYYPAE